MFAGDRKLLENTDKLTSFQKNKQGQKTFRLRTLLQTPFFFFVHQLHTSNSSVSFVLFFILFTSSGRNLGFWSKIRFVAPQLPLLSLDIVNYDESLLVISHFFFVRIVDGYLGFFVRFSTFLLSIQSTIV